jgi:hypothetical protein
MNDLDWLVGRKFQSLDKEYVWVIVFYEQTSLTIECLWRLIEQQKIRRTSADDGQQFGRPAPVDAAAEVNRLLAGTVVESIELREGTLDLAIRFSSGHVFEIIVDSSGYEAWHLCGDGREFIACGGGNLAIFNTPTRT